MIAVITGDIVDSRKLKDPQDWLKPLRSLLQRWGEERRQWEIFRGDSFQVEISHPQMALERALAIKAKIKSVKGDDSSKRTSPIDVRMSIGIGASGQAGENIATNVGKAYYHSGEAFEQLKNKSQHLMVKTDWADFDRDVNLMLKLGMALMDNWTINSAEVMDMVFEHPRLRQVELAAMLSLEQHSVSGRLKRAYYEEIMELDKVFRIKINDRLG